MLLDIQTIKIYSPNQVLWYKLHAQFTLFSTEYLFEALNVL